MKTVLIVEDEKMIRQGIHTMVARSGVPIEVIMECGNGEMAWEVLKQQPVDVVFTDIRMPKMDGIELTRHIKTLENPPMVVAVSGYDDFSYAVEMLRNGVREYILKPVERNKIKDILEKIEAELVGKKQIEESEINFGKQQIKLLLSSEDLSDEELATYEDRYGNLFYSGDYKIIAVAKNTFKDTEPNVIIVDSFDDLDVAIVECGNADAFIAMELTDSCIGISAAHRGIRHLQTAFREAQAARKRAFCIGRSVNSDEEITRVPEGLKNEALKLIDEQANTQRLQLIGTTRTDELDSQWEKLFVATKREHLSPDEFCNAVTDFLQNVQKIYKNAIQDEMMESLNRLCNILSFSDIDTYREELTNWVVGLHEKLHADEDSGSNKKLKMAVDYIEQNYAKDLNMAVVSNYISMNYSMLSYLFKQYTGTNFVNYLKDIRMREAKKLLAETDLKIIEVSSRVGYDNEKHFMKIFKNECGVSPSEYRKNMQRTL